MIANYNKSLESFPEPYMTLEENLLQASKCGNIEEVRDLLESGVDVNAKDKHGWTSLHYASRAGNINIMKILLNKGADAHAKTYTEGVTPLHCASGGQHPEKC